MKFEINNICCIGAGFVGGPTMAVIAENCPDIEINVVDLNYDRVERWNDKDLSNLPIYEPGLENIIKKCRGKNLHFSTAIEEKLKIADMIFISVNTPTKLKGLGAGKASDLRWIEESTRQIAKNAKDNVIVVEKSTLPVRTADTIKKILNSRIDNSSQLKNKKNFYVLSNPEFLAEGTAIENLQRPDRVLIGGDNEMAIDALAEIYKKWIDQDKILQTNLWSSELSKLSANALLAQRISSINSLTAVCECTGADITEVVKAVGMDSRIGSKFLEPGPGFGGSCFKKDILNLIYICDYYGLEEVSSYWLKVLEINSWQKTRISNSIVDKLFGTLSCKKICVLGFAFKANTNDTRESPAIDICKSLLEEGANLSIYDPRVSHKQIEKDLNQHQTLSIRQGIDQGKWKFEESIYKAANESDAVVLLTEWKEFKDINWKEVSAIMRKPSWLFDTRLVSDINQNNLFGINIWKTGFGITN